MSVKQSVSSHEIPISKFHLNVKSTGLEIYRISLAPIFEEGYKFPQREIQLRGPKALPDGILSVEGLHRLLEGLSRLLEKIACAIRYCAS